MATATNCITVVRENYNMIVNIDFSWKIRDFSTQHKKISSPPFSPSPTISEKFYVSSERKRFQYITAFMGSDCYFKLERCSEESCSQTLRVQFDVKILNSDGAVLKSSTDKSSYLLHKEKSILLLQLDSWNDYLECRDAFLATTDDVVIVNFHFEFFEHNMTTKSNGECVAVSSDFRALFESQTLCDLKIRVSFKIIEAHQVVLAAPSSVLKNMIENSSSKSKCLVINDVDHDIFECFLKYLYSGDIEDKTCTRAWKLYPLADKYDVSCLRKVCSDILVSNLTVNNALALCNFSYRHNDESLQFRVLRFIKTNFSELETKPKWKNLMDKNLWLFVMVSNFLSNDVEMFSEIP